MITEWRLILCPIKQFRRGVQACSKCKHKKWVRALDSGSPECLWTERGDRELEKRRGK